MFLSTTTVNSTLPSPCSPYSITKHTHLLIIHLPLVNIRITWCKMATGVALQIFIRTYHAMDFPEFVWEVTVLPTVNCMAKPHDCVSLTSVIVYLIEKVWWMHINTVQYTGIHTSRLALRRVFRVLEVRCILRLCTATVYCVGGRLKSSELGAGGKPAFNTTKSYILQGKKLFYISRSRG